jgi:DNA-binding winged helix-turn-helix (wHTH) protein
VRVHFGDCVFDTSVHELRKGGQPVHLPPKSYQLLELLLSHRPRPVTKAEIRDALWPKTSVGLSSLARVVVELRSAIGDDARRPRFLRTVHGLGYSFQGESFPEGQPRSRPDDALACRLMSGDREIALGEGEHLIGRGPDVAVWIDAVGVSRRHARIVVSGGRATLEDLGSKNGTYLGGKKLQGPSELSDGDTINVGSVVLGFRAARVAVSTETVSPGERGKRVKSTRS